MTKIIAVLLISLYLSVATGLLVDNTYSTCSIQGITYVRGFKLKDHVEACYHYGSKILYDSPLVKVSSHTYMNESTMTVDWMSTKVFVEFYGDIYGLPIALFSSDLLMCTCAAPCLANRTEAMGLGVDSAVELIVRREYDESYVAYLNYRRANVTLFIRKTTEGFNFGIRVPEYLEMHASGVCVSGCSRLVDQVAVYECLSDDYIKPAIDVCRQAFIGLEQYYAGDVSFEKMRLVPCARDVFIWRNASAALAYRHAYIDELLLSQFDTIMRQYNETFMYFEFNWIQYDDVVEQMVRKCEKIPQEDVISINRTDVVGRISAASNVTVFSKQPLPLNSTGSGRIAMIDLSGEDTFTPTNKTRLPVDLEQVNNMPVSNETIRVDLTSDRFVDISRPEEYITDSFEIKEWRVKCERQRSTKLGVFYLSYPTNLTMFVQCDESNRAFLKICPIGTIFTVKMVCERMITKSSVVEINTTQTVLPKPTTLQKPKLSELFKGKAPLQIQLVETPIDTVTTTVMPSPVVMNPCTNETLAQRLFFFPYPLDATKYIQCDNFNRMTIGQCVVGTRFSVELRTCQKF